MAQQVDNNKYVVDIENGGKISHVALFLLPDVELDSQFTALVYFQLPNQEFQLLGSISAAKPSAIFKLNNSVQNSHTQINDDIDMDSEGMPTAGEASSSIKIGISIEPSESAQVLLNEASEQNKQKQLALTHRPSSTTISPSNPTTTALLANKIVKNAYNYMSSFIDNDGKVNIKIFDSWWDKFKIRLQNDPKFLDSQE